MDNLVIKMGARHIRKLISTSPNKYEWTTIQEGEKVEAKEVETKKVKVLKPNKKKVK